MVSAVSRHANRRRERAEIQSVGMEIDIGEVRRIARMRIVFLARVRRAHHPPIGGVVLNQNEAKVNSSRSSASVKIDVVRRERGEPAAIFCGVNLKPIANPPKVRQALGGARATAIVFELTQPQRCKNRQNSYREQDLEESEGAPFTSHFRSVSEG